ncbi:DUF4440 domain-containing protein [Hymenobacter sp. HMF4947]|uniref:DUF4440 domain-containing protein n=1 Tax=Hymenobacter ginkgonis TaxID=2682976 RepID=A0A7K1T9B4_9BACT|nr:nuclear transport factor 2 family protein [Hymenobacter ginkgonis]MVN74999.1 DUF4440 domain-containing protein [Hymenobacter ginkgonis]
MKIAFLALACGAALAGCFSACSSAKSAVQPNAYRPDDPALYATITRLDSTFFAAYNTCAVNLATYGAFYADSVEFYHDKGGVMTSKQDIIESTKRNVCGKVTRELVRGSIEVYPIHGYGAVEMGLHKFHNHTEQETTPPRAGKFVILWQHRHNEWRIARVISLH